MKPFELMYLCLEPFLPVLYRQVRIQMRSVANSYPYRPNILDVGGRKSHYTIGVPAEITITDLPRSTEIQRKLNLGITEDSVIETTRRRSNVRQILIDDMTRSSLPDHSFELVVAVEVLEHVEDDILFLKEVNRVLKPGGIFLMSTPNGDAVQNTNPDHKRHYTREQLSFLLCSHFTDAKVEYAIHGGVFYMWGLASWQFRHPLRTIMSMVGNLISSFQSVGDEIKQRSYGTQHLIATAKKPVPDMSETV